MLAALGADCQRLSAKGAGGDVREGAGGERVGQST